MNTAPKRNTFGIIGVAVAFLALLTVLVGPSIHEALFPKPALEDRIADTAVRIRDRIAARLNGAPPPEKPAALRLDSNEVPYSISLALAGISIVQGCMSYLCREDHRFAYVACGVGSLTLAWHAVLLAAGAIVVCVIIFAVLSFLGVS